MPSVIQRGGDPAQSSTAFAKPSDLIQHGLLAGVWLEVLPISAKPVAELYVAHPLSVGTLVAHGVPGAFADRLVFPLAYSCRTFDRPLSRSCADCGDTLQVDRSATAQSAERWNA